MSYIHVVGNRPQFIKLAMLHRAIARCSAIPQKILHTGQHYDPEMSDVFFKELDIPPPDFQLSVNQLPHYAQIGRMTELIGQILEQKKNSRVIVYGDTNTTLAGALATKKNRLLLAHVEAGIRTFDERMPEESNRYLADRMADLNFCPTVHCLDNLKAEGISTSTTRKAVFTGDIMLDAWHHAQAFAGGSAASPLPSYPFVLATVHREENNNSPENLAEILHGLNEIHKTLPVIMPCHPATRSKIKSLNIIPLFEMRPPSDYTGMMQLLNAASFVVTDSGGLCREAFFSKKPSVVLMKHPFWPEIIQDQACLQSDVKQRHIVTTFEKLQHARPAFNTALFGSGNAAGTMAAIIEEEWKQ